MKVSFAMRKYDMAEAFRRATERAKSDLDEAGEKVKRFHVRLLSVGYQEDKSPENRAYTWEFEVSR